MAMKVGILWNALSKGRNLLKFGDFYNRVLKQNLEKFLVMPRKRWSNFSSCVILNDIIEGSKAMQFGCSLNEVFLLLCAVANPIVASAVPDRPYAKIFHKTDSSLQMG